MRTKQQFVLKSIERHPGADYEYNKVPNIINSKYDYVTITCKKHGDFNQSVRAHLRPIGDAQGCPICACEGRITTDIEFLEKANNKHNHKYTYLNLPKLVHSEYMVEILCPESDHGIFFQRCTTHMTQGAGCQKCAGVLKITREVFRERSNIEHEYFYNYDKVHEFKSIREKVIITCPEHGDFLQIVEVHMYGHGGCSRCSGHTRITYDEAVIRGNIKHEGKYTYPLQEIKNSHSKMRIICPEHGEFIQLVYGHLNAGNGCPGCLKISFEEIVKRSNLMHGNKFIYPPQEITLVTNKMRIICPEHGEFMQQACVHYSTGNGCPWCSSSKGEREIKKYLDVNHINYIAQKEFPNCKNINCLSFDFYLPDHNICIEYDGEQHFGSYEFFGGDIGFKKRQKHDKIKNDFCEKSCIKLLRIPYYDFEEIPKILEFNIVSC